MEGKELEKKLEQQKKFNELQRSSAMKYSQKKKNGLNIKKSKPPSKGKRRIKVEEFQNQLKKIFKGNKCESTLCNNILGLDDSRIVTEHLLQQGKFPEYAIHPKNVAFVCGCINLDDFPAQEERLFQIEKHFPGKINWVKKSITKVKKEK